MKKNLSIYTIAAAALFAMSCNKLVDIPSHPIDQISESTVFSDSADIISAVAGVYNNFKANASSGTIGATQVTIYTGLAADELKYSYSSTYVNNAYLADDGTVSGLWSSAYTNLYQMNACIAGISATKAISDSLKRALVAEVKFDRAFYYFQMVNLWGGVPLVTVTDYNVTATQPRVSVDEVYKLIQTDLAEARSVLQPKYPSIAGTRYRPNLYTAMALSAKVFLYRQQWDSAALMVNQILASGLYSLASTPTTVFYQTSNESIWALPGSNVNTSSTNFQTGEGYILLPSSIYSAPAYQVNPILVNAFEQNDLRKATWITQATLYGTTYNYPTKYKNRLYDAANREVYVMFRLADMYLVLAEAQAHLGAYSDAITNLNIVRTRAGLGGYTGSNDDLLAAIYHERQVEMAFEWGNRWYDLKRTGTIDAVLGAEKTTWKKEAALFPIPVGQIQLNPNLTQNDGY
ncbi:RagB/SusD family nutrient uptake outer membrane protein [Chitinophaga sancti]|uniref:RagB/SusD family nutrient uptake outer membrane protein n=1 Tax=Chitinophaga sancti TaxID=1004 RepID=A0A1K1PXD6_9BACT|nr:RagB/SusD family nutrient uptake outer membrane protein [Chitinophaga sancti]WQD61516.1 RagB/SusD family nutrient uptake outer membrane protein [Chitinophaga sancti]WQG92927.1 RagB/SusD family nutrient uptake outer membrane protein [Chitinophaga sancti]SFW52410.1 Starch-binding associating with outer membrane [Chitinophaga sancti]